MFEKRAYSTNYLLEYTYFRPGLLKGVIVLSPVDVIRVLYTLRGISAAQMVRQWILSGLEALQNSQEPSGADLVERTVIVDGRSIGSGTLPLTLRQESR